MENKKIKHVFGTCQKLFFQKQRSYTFKRKLLILILILKHKSYTFQGKLLILKQKSFTSVILLKC